MDFTLDSLQKVLTCKNLSALMSYRYIKKVYEINPDIIHITTSVIFPLPFFFLLYKIDKKIPVIFTNHYIHQDANPLVEFIGYIHYWGDRLLNYRKIVAHTEVDKSELIKRDIFPSNKIVVIPHGASSLFKAHEKNISEERNCIIYFGYIREYKGIEYLLKAVPIICEEIPNLKVIIAGEGDFSPYRNLIDNTYDLNLEIYNQYIPDELISVLFQRSEIVVLPYSQMTGQSGVLNIACGLQKPVVACDVGGMSEIIEDGITGFLVRPKDSKALASAIIKLLKENRLREKMKENMHRKSLDLNWDNIAKKHIEVYKNAINM